MEYLLHHLLKNSAARHPAATAVRMEDRALTYEQLDRLTNQVARMLRDVGVRPGDRVGIYVHKSLASIIAIFGILKAGGAYVPLDPNAPPGRLAYITRDCGIEVLLSTPDKLNSLSGFFTEGTPLRTVLLLDTTAATVDGLPPELRLVSREEIGRQSDAACEPPATIETDLAYILYTSGSTGVPKGVMISHRTIFTFINWCRDTFQLRPEDRVTSHAPLHFDLSTFDIFATLQAGATMILVGEKLSTLPVKLADLLQNEKVTVTYLVPSILSLMVNYGRLDAHDFSALRTVLFAGEVFPIKYLRRLVAAIPHAAYYNLYGPTETNVCTYHQVQAADLSPERGERPVPIGKACENTHVFAVSESGQRVTGPGVEGELWVRGSCVAQGYWGDREKTAKSFVPDPFQTLFPEMAYRTGDIVTLASDGESWNYVGRRDHMIKSRGYRIELGEIETTLYRHEQVKEAAVVAIPDDLLGNRIRAFVVPVAAGAVSPAELTAFCAGRLPKYMLPESFELRESLPKTSSGKTDRTALASRPAGKDAAKLAAIAVVSANNV